VFAQYKDWGNIRLALEGSPVRIYLAQLDSMLEITRKIIEGNGIYAKGLHHIIGEEPTRTFYYRFNPPHPMALNGVLRQMAQVNGLGISEVMLFDIGRDQTPLQFAVAEAHKAQLIDLLAKIHSYLLQIPGENPRVTDLRINLPEIISRIKSVPVSPKSREASAEPVTPTTPAAVVVPEPAEPIIPAPLTVAPAAVAVPNTERKIMFKWRKSYGVDQVLNALTQAVVRMKSAPNVRIKSRRVSYYSFAPADPELRVILAQLTAEIPRGKYKNLRIDDIKDLNDRLQFITDEYDLPEEEMPKIGQLFQSIKDLILKESANPAEGESNLEAGSIVRQALKDFAMLENVLTSSEDVAFQSHAEHVINYLKMKLFKFHDLHYDREGNYVADLTGIYFDAINRPIIRAVAENLHEFGVKMIDQGSRLGIKKDQFAELSGKLDDILTAIKEKRLFSMAPEDVRPLLRQGLDALMPMPGGQKFPSIGAVRETEKTNGSGQELMGTKGLEAYLRDHSEETLPRTAVLARTFKMTEAMVYKVLKKPEFVEIKIKGKRGPKPESKAKEGGINLNTAYTNWTVTKDGVGVQMAIDPALLERMKLEGVGSLSPVIFRIISISSVWALLGLLPPRQILP